MPGAVMVTVLPETVTPSPETVAEAPVRVTVVADAAS